MPALSPLSGVLADPRALSGFRPEALAPQGAAEGEPPGLARRTGAASVASIGPSAEPRPEDVEAAQQAQQELIERLRAGADPAAPARLRIDRNEESGRFVYSIMNPETGETLRQFPPETYLDLVAFLRSGEGGIIDEAA